MENLNLKPCPFCGGNNITIEVDVVNPDRIFSGQAVCDECDARGKSDFWHDDEHEAKEGAIKSWNTRASGWISVDEKLPDEDDYVLVFTDEGRAFVSFLFINHRGMFFEVEDDCGVVVTHWMPLPQPPEVKHG